MGWTYEPTSLDLPLNQVRLRLGDTLERDPQLQDEEIEFLLEQAGDSVVGATLAGARLLAARYARQVDKWVGDLKILASQRHRHYLAMEEELLATAVGSHGYPVAGGIRVSDKEIAEGNDDLVAPFFRRNMHDNLE